MSSVLASSDDGGLAHNTNAIGHYSNFDQIKRHLEQYITTQNDANNRAALTTNILGSSLSAEKLTRAIVDNNNSTQR